MNGRKSAAPFHSGQTPAADKPVPGSKRGFGCFLVGFLKASRKYQTQMRLF